MSNPFSNVWGLVKKNPGKTVLAALAASMALGEDTDVIGPNDIKEFLELTPEQQQEALAAMPANRQNAMRAALSQRGMKS